MGGFKVLVLFSVIFSTRGELLKVCAKLKDIQDCTQIDRSEIVHCDRHLHNVDCMLAIERGNASFGRITPEEALVGANNLKDVVVLAEFRSDSSEDDDSEFATVILIRKGMGGGFQKLRNKKYCHPGFKFDNNDYMLKEFENLVLRSNNAEGCSNKVESKTLLEKEIKAVADFFGPSCRPGPWVGYDEYDTFYDRYNRLCELCKNKSCKDAPSSFMDSIQCLVDGGDVALTTLHNSYAFFNKSENADKLNTYGYLCPNGEDVDLSTPCTWSKQPWNIIIANKESESSVRRVLENRFSKDTIGGSSSADSGDSFSISLKAVLFPEGPSKIKFLETAPSLLNYLQEFRQIPTATDKCNENIKWCTVSIAEQKKCEWLSQAATNVALQPTIRCQQSQNKFSCLEDIKIGTVDLVAADAHFGYISRRKNLAPLAYPDTDFINRIKPVIAIKVNDTNIRKLEDLKGKKACFPEYGGIEWMAFVNLYREREILPKSSCDYGKLISDFVGDACMPGAHDKEHETSTEIDKDKLCRLCEQNPYESKTSTNCNSNSENAFYGNEGALSCLKKHGDFAVVTAAAYPDANEYKVLCKNGSLALYNGFNVDENCALTLIVDSEVLSKKDNAKNPNLQIILLNLETRFGFYHNKAFDVFNVFNNTADLLFKDSTQGLTRVDSDKTPIKNFVNLLADHEKCVEIKGNNTAAQVEVILPILFTSLAILTVLN